ncbi:DUF6543 domain-containing protein [Pseudomonas sp. W4I3]|uniref:DUF6543 domain-containing protein n=1 Tax=Pseudomonas sp. W4I3 TaxID=3042294 RepID=UPI00277E9A27|nr:DUF6543 domain-containing protein [Pseudomonas sp. W4I3]MDQ0740662.1 hypothetical protein [Pseudomonas sp. W4I3]
MSTTTSPIDHVTQSRHYLGEVFADRPRLEEVIDAVLQREIDDQWPASGLNVSHLRLGRVLAPAGQDQPATYGALLSLGDLLLTRIMQGTLLNLTATLHVLLDRQRDGSWKPVARSPSVDELEALINRVAPSLLEAYQARLVDYWSQVSRQDPLSTRWRIVADQLRRCLKFGPQSPPLPADEYRKLLWLFYPLKAERERHLGQGAVRVFQVYACEEGGAGEWLVVLLIESRPLTVSTFYLFSPGTGVQRLRSREDLAHLLPLHMSRRYTGQRVEWAVREPEDDVFDAMAQMLLEKQLRDLAALRWSDFPDVQWYKQRFRQLTAPQAWFGVQAGPDGMPEQVLPAWLQGANAADRLRASRLLDALHAVQVEAAGADYLDGLDPIHVYASKALQARMRLDYPQEVVISPDDYMMTFTRTLGGTVGWTESISRTLTEWALDNPFTEPYAQVTITNRVEPGYIPDWWLTIDYVKRLIPAVDIGKHYPALLKRNLLDDPAERQRRQALFVGQTRAQLPLAALECLLRRRQGLTRIGMRWVEAAVQPTAQAREVDGHEIVARPLAFLTHAGGRVYPAANMFVIGPQNDALQPHLLYRPGSDTPLQEWASRQELLDAIASVGPLQTEVLNSLDPQGRAVLGNGGFRQPHTQRQGQGGEFAPIEVPARALLSDQEVPGDFLAYLFSSNAQALVKRAEAQSRSNEDKRWAAFRADIGRLFNVVMPLLRGPLATVGWLYQSLLSARAFITLPVDADDDRRGTTIADAVASLAGILLYPVASLDERIGLVEVEPAPTATRPPVEIQQAATLSELRRRSRADFLPMDVGWHSAGEISPVQQKALDTYYKWRQDGKPWPVIPQNIETEGVRKGLVRVPTGGDRYTLHALIRGGLYPVMEVAGGIRVFDPQQPERFGPLLKRDAAGGWQFDLRLRLAGGMPKPSGAQRRAEILRREADFKQRYNEQTQAQLIADEKAGKEHVYYERVYRTEREKFNDELRRSIYLRYQAALREQNQCQFQRLETLKVRNANKPLPAFETELIEQLQNIVHTLQERGALLEFARKSATPARATLDAWNAQLDSGDQQIRQQAHDNTLNYLNQIAELNQQLIELSTLEYAYDRELQAVPGLERQTSLPDETVQRRLSPLDWKVQQVSVLQGLLFKRAPVEAEFYDFIALKDATDKARGAVRSQQALQEPGFMTVEERVQAHGDVMEKYTQALGSLRLYRQTLNELLDHDYTTRLVNLIEALHGEAEHSLALLLRDQARQAESAPMPQASPVPQPRPVPGSRRRMVRTRDKRILVGVARARTPEEPNEIVDVVDPVDNVPVASYRQSPEKDIWEEVNPQPAPLPPERSITRLLQDARLLLDDQHKQVGATWNDAQTSNSPIALEAVLCDRARQLDALHGKISQRDPGKTQVLSDLASAALYLREQGRLIRIEVIKRNPPEANRVDYLKTQGEVEILKIEGRVRLSRPNDYLQEYVVRDRSKRPLAYAHFHYRSKQAPLADFVAGHLKMPAQRFNSYLMGAGQSEGQYLTVYRAQINAALAGSLFFGVNASVKRGAGFKFW